MKPVFTIVPANKIVVDGCGCITESDYRVIEDDGHCRFKFRICLKRHWCEKHVVRANLTTCEHPVVFDAAALRFTLRVLTFLMPFTALLGLVIGTFYGRALAR